MLGDHNPAVFAFQAVQFGGKACGMIGLCLSRR